MAWRRGKGKDSGPVREAPALETIPEVIEDLPVIQEDGIAQQREARKQVKRAEADLKRLERKRARVLKKEEKRLRQIDRNIAKMEMSRDTGPLTLMLSLVVINGVAAAYIMVALWWPEWQLVPPLFMENDHEWEVVAICYTGFSGFAAWLFSDNRSPSFLERARHSLMVYFGLGLLAIFVGILVSIIMIEMELMVLDWVLWEWVLVYLVAGSALPMTLIYLVAHRAGSRAFLTATYHHVMGTLNAILVVALIILGFVFMAHMGIMEEVGTSLVMIGGLMGIFVWPAMVTSWYIEDFGVRLMGLRASD
jgi:hypothetical protein